MNKEVLLRKFKTLIWIIIHPKYIIGRFLFGKLCFMLPDTMFANQLYIRIRYKYFVNKPLSFENPKTFTEKLQYLKLYNRKEIYKTMTNKYEAKKYVADIIGEKYIIPLLGVWDNADDIDYDKLPNKFVLKCTHDSGGYVICLDKDKLDKEKVNKHLNKCLSIDYWKIARETAYMHDKYRIIAEKYLFENGELPLEYSFFCFHGKVRFISQHIDQANNGGKVSYFDENKNYFTIKGMEEYLTEEKYIISDKIDEMINLAEILSKDIPHVRMDFFVSNDEIYVGEFTFNHSGGFFQFPDNLDEYFGDMIDLSKI